MLISPNENLSNTRNVINGSLVYRMRRREKIDKEVELNSNSSNFSLEFQQGTKQMQAILQASLIYLLRNNIF